MQEKPLPWAQLLAQLHARFGAFKDPVGAAIAGGSLSPTRLYQHILRLQKRGWLSTSLTPTAPPQKMIALTDLGKNVYTNCRALLNLAAPLATRPTSEPNRSPSFNAALRWAEKVIDQTTPPCARHNPEEEFEP
jgi:DNA-binding PadR family transcriptional regulator